MHTQTAVFFTIVFLVISSMSMFMGVNILMAGRRALENRLFFVISFLLGLWAFGFSAATIAPTAAQCLVWRRVAALGWSVIFSVIVHFTLSFTGYDKLLTRRWVYVPIYLPAVLCAWVFSLSTPMAESQYHLVKVGSLWVNEQVNNGWDYFFYTYLAAGAIITMALFFRQWHRCREDDRGNQALALLLAFGAAILLGTVTDLVNSTYWLLPIPQMAPLAFLIPILVVDHNMRKHSLMVKPADNELEIIMNSQTRSSLLFFMAVVLMSGSVIYFLTQHLIDGRPLGEVAVLTGMLLAAGIMVALLQKLSKKNQNLESLIIGIAMATIPIVTLSFMSSAGITIWAFPFIFIVLSMLFNNRRLLVGASITTLLTQALMWIAAPNKLVDVNSSDYLVRLGILALSIWIALYVNTVYVRRLKENADKNRYQKLISEVSAQMVSITEDNRQDKMSQALRQAAACLSAKTSFLCLINTEGDSVADVTVWQGQKTRKCLVQDESANQVLIGILSAGPVTDNSGLRELHQWAAFMAENQITSVLSHPIVLSGACMGFLGLAYQEKSTLLADQIETIKVLSNIFADSLSRLAAEREIEFMAYHDHLTALPNRRLFTDRTEQAIHLAKRNATMIAVIFLDLDSFKSLNDTLGHRLGDALIREVARKLTGSVRKSDTVSRFGGDEFLIMLNNMESRQDIVKVTNSLMGLFDGPLQLQGQEFFVTASAGIAVYPQDGDNTDTLLKNADIAVNRAKDKGKNQYLFCSEDMKEETRYKAQLSNDLYRALDRGELMVYYQPQIALKSQRIVGVEALLRWSHPQFGQVSPGVFIPLAEKTGLIGTIGDWVLRQACAQASAWQAKGLPPIRIAANISAIQLHNPQFAEQLRQMLEKHRLAPERLELEVTESVAIREPVYIIGLLNQLKQIGVQLSIDDFGTEYSSLSRLKQLPVDRIKIDMQFVQGMEKNEKDLAITKVIINLAKSLRIKVIAEGVENAEQLVLLGHEQCDEVQGFYYYKPMPPEELEKVLAGMKEKEMEDEETIA